MMSENAGSWETAAAVRLLEVYLQKLQASEKGMVHFSDWEEVAQAVSQVQRKTVRQCRNKVDALKKRLKRPAKEGAPATAVDDLLRDISAVSTEKAAVAHERKRTRPASPKNPNPRKSNSNAVATAANDCGEEVYEEYVSDTPDDGDDSNTDDDSDDDDDDDEDDSDDDDEPPSPRDRLHPSDDSAGDNSLPTRAGPSETKEHPKDKGAIHPSPSKLQNDSKGSHYYQERLSNPKGAHHSEAPGPSSPDGTPHFKATPSSPQRVHEFNAIPSGQKGASQLEVQHRSPYITSNTANVPRQSYKFASSRASEQPHEGSKPHATPLASKKRTSGAFDAKVQQEIDKICKDVTTSIRGPKRLQVLTTADSTQALANAISHLTEVYADIQLAKLHLFRVTHQKDQNEP